jgi:uncharacterized protein (UPF0332 family)
MASGEKLVEIAELEEWAQLAFEGMTSLNRIQSRIYPAAFHSNENLLVCARSLFIIIKHVHQGYWDRYTVLTSQN